MEIDYKLIDDVEIDGIDTRDYPDFCDAFICRCKYNGREATDEELDEINEDRSYVLEQVYEWLF